MAIFAAAAEVVRVDNPDALAVWEQEADGQAGWFQGVAVGAGGAGSGVFAVLVAAFAGQVGVTGVERKAAVVYGVVEEGNKNGLNEPGDAGRGW